MKDIRKTSHETYKTGISDTRIVCVKFRYEPRPTENYAWFRRGSRDAGVGSDESRKVSGVGVEDDEMNASEETVDTVVFILHMLDEYGEMTSA